MINYRIPSFMNDKKTENWQKEIFSNKKLQGKIVAIVDEKIVAFANSYTELLKKVKHCKSYSFYAVPHNINEVRILPIRIKSLKKHQWQPIYSIHFFSQNRKSYTERMLVDSGADFSLITLDFGKLLGLKTTAGEIPLVAEGIGGSVSYFLREVKMEIDGHKFSAPVAWLVNPKINDMIIGRETIFDLFDIEFKQAEEKISFTKR